MDKRTLENWKKVKEALEAAGKTDTFYYQRALTILPERKIPSRLNSSFSHTMLKSILGVCAALAIGPAAVASPYVNIENNTGFEESGYGGTATDMHIGIEGTAGSAAWYVQVALAVAPSGQESSVEFSAKGGGSIALSDSFGIYGELSGITGDTENSFGTKIGAKFSF